MKSLNFEIFSQNFDKKIVKIAYNKVFVFTNKYQEHFLKKINKF